MKKETKIALVIVLVIVLILFAVFLYFKMTYLSHGEVKAEIAKEMNVKEEDLYFEKIELDLDSGLYEVDVYYDNQDYEFKLDGKKGDVVQTDYIPATDSPTPAPSVEGLGELTGEEAKQVALSDAQVTEEEVTNLRVETDYDDQVLVYEIDFVSGETEYDYKIRASDGTILESDKDHRNH